MLGFFDSGLGGLAILKESIRLMPEYSYIYLGDNARAPYGSRNQEEIYGFTRQGVEHLFSRGAKLVILACNTSSSAALRKLQQEFLVKNYPDRRILGIVIPTAEEGAQFGNMGILATEATAQSMAYPKEIAKINPGIIVFQKECPRLVPLIESGELENDELESAVKKYITEFLEEGKNIKTLILGCTHYELIRDVIKKYVPDSVRILKQGDIVAEKLKDYLNRHPEIASQLIGKGERVFLTTGESERVKNLFAKFYGEEMDLQKISL